MNLPQKKEYLSVMVPVEVAGGEVDVLVFFKNRAGLQVTSNFNRYVLSGAEQGLVSVDGTTLGGTILMQYVNDMGIHDGLPSGHAFSSVNIFLARLAIMIDDQLEGESGALPVDGFSSIFYVEVDGEDISVDVIWCPKSSSWVCNACPDDYAFWVSGHRVFSAVYLPQV